MTEDEYKSLQRMTDAQLFDFTGETASSERGWAARHILSMRVATVASTAAKGAAWAAGFSAIAALLSLLHQFYKASQ